MKKFFLAVVSVILAVLMCTAGLFGCNLITTDNERDMAQVLATVKISDKEDKIYKKDFSIAYMNYGYIYEQYYGYTRKQTVEYIVNMLVNTRVILQNAIEEFDGGVAPFDTLTLNPAITDKWNLERYLDEDEIVDAKYDAYSSLNNLLDTYAKVGTSDKVGDTLTATVRTVPTDAQNDTELTVAEKQTYINKGFEITGNRRKAFKKVVELLDANGLLGKDYDGKTLESTDYFKKTLTNNEETLIIEKFEKIIKDEARKTVAFSALENAYLKDKEGAENFNASEFSSALSSATAASPILYGAYGNYGYVYNLLIGADDEQSAKITALNSDKTYTDTERQVERNKILATTTAQDLRSTWILSGYDCEDYVDGGVNTVKFTGDYTFNDAVSLPFKGEVKKLVEKTDTESAVYSVLSVNKYMLGEFVELVEDYVYGSAQAAAVIPEFDYKDSVYKFVSSNGGVDAYEDKINELLFAFSTDGGSLNTYKGYAIAPKPDGTDSEKYVSEFAEAARILIQEGGNSYIMVATDYGYHILFFSQLFDGNFDAGATLQDYLNTLDFDKGGKTWEEVYTEMLDGWDDYENTGFYLYALASKLNNTVVTNALSEKEKGVLNTYVYGANGKYVKINSAVYDSLIG